MAPKVFRTLLLAGVSASVVVAPVHARVNLAASAQLRHTISGNDLPGIDDWGWASANLGGRLAVDLRKLDVYLNGNVGVRAQTFGGSGEGYSLNGNGGMRAALWDDALLLEGSVRATQRQGGNNVSSFALTDFDNDETVQLVAIAFRPTLRGRIGDNFSTTASYSANGLIVDGRGNVRNNGFQSGFSQQLNSRLAYGSDSERLRLGAQATYRMRDNEFLDQEYRGLTYAGDITYFLSRKLSIGARGGYEDIRNTQAEVLRDPVTGEAILDGNGNVQQDPSRPRRLAFEREGAFGQAGFRYAPNRRTEIAASAGYRYGDEYYNARLNYRPTPRLRLSAGLSHGLSSFDRRYSNASFRFPDTFGSGGPFGTRITSVDTPGNSASDGAVFGSGAVELASLDDGATFSNASAAATQFANKSAVPSNRQGGLQLALFQVTPPSDEVINPTDDGFDDFPGTETPLPVDPAPTDPDIPADPGDPGTPTDPVDPGSPADPGGQDDGFGEFPDGGDTPGFPELIDDEEGVGDGEQCPLGFDPVLEECLGDDFFLPITNATYRGTTAHLTANYGRDNWTVGATLRWNERSYVDVEQLSGLGDTTNVPDISAESISMSIRYGLRFSDRSRLSVATSYAHSGAFLGRGDFDYIRLSTGYRFALSRDVFANVRGSLGYRTSNGISSDVTTYSASAGIGYRF